MSNAAPLQAVHRPQDVPKCAGAAHAKSPGKRARALQNDKLWLTPE
jgi:hypothetical protein